MKINSTFALAAGLAALISTSASADVFGGGAGGALPDSVGGSNNLALAGVFNSTINVGAVGNIVSFNSVTLTGLSHTWAGDLQVWITSPTGTRVNLFSRIGNTTATGFGNSNDFSGNYTFNTGGPLPSAAGAIPAGTYGRSTNTNAAVVQFGTDGLTQGINNNAFAAFAGQSVTGVWTLSIRDMAAGDVGSLGSWSFDATIPGPGAVALLGLAGLVGGRRRRA